MDAWSGQKYTPEGRLEWALGGYGGWDVGSQLDLGAAHLKCGADHLP